MSESDKPQRAAGSAGRGRGEKRERENRSPPPRKMAARLKEEKPWAEDGWLEKTLGPGLSYSLDQRQRKGERRTFYCTLCLVDLTSIATMVDHATGVKHTQKHTEVRQQMELQFRRGEISREQCGRPHIIPRPNPAKTKVRLPVRLHDAIIKSSEPVVGLDYLTEFLPVSDPELDPEYQCELCGNKGNAHGMLSHILGRKHRQAFVVEINKDDPRRVLDLSQSQLLHYARKYAENSSKLREKIRTVRSDEEYPAWPPGTGRAAWSLERGGTRSPPPDRGNWGSSREGRTLPSVSSIQPPADLEEAVKMVSLAQRMLECGLDYIQPTLSPVEASLIRATISSLIYRLFQDRL